MINICIDQSVGRSHGIVSVNLSSGINPLQMTPSNFFWFFFSENFAQILDEHGECINMSIKMPMFGPVVLKITDLFINKICHIFPLKHVVSMKNIKAYVNITIS